MDHRFRRLSHCAVVVALLIGLLVFPAGVAANPYFFIEGNAWAVTGSDQTWSVKLYTDAFTVTAAQTVITFNPSFFAAKMTSTVSSRCNFWAPADPSLGYGNTVAPYFYSTNRFVFSCGFSNPGYVSSSATGDLVAKFTLTPLASGSSTFSFSNTMLRYIGNTISPSTSPTFDVSSFGSTTSAQPTPTPTPTPTPNPNATSSATPTPTPGPTASAAASPTTLYGTDLNFVEIGSVNLSGTGVSPTGDPLVAVEEDDSIPGAPDMSPRPRATPYVPGAMPEGQTEDGGEVLSIQSLRELLIPGKSEADRTVVLVNLISTLTFLALLAIVIWRLITSSRMNKLKYRHLTDMLSSELSVLESKLGAIDGGKSGQMIRSELDEALKNLMGEAGEDGKSKGKK